MVSGDFYPIFCGTNPSRLHAWYAEILQIWFWFSFENLSQNFSVLMNTFLQTDCSLYSYCSLWGSFTFLLPKYDASLSSLVKKYLKNLAKFDSAVFMTLSEKINKIQ